MKRHRHLVVGLVVLLFACGGDSQRGSLPTDGGARGQPAASASTATATELDGTWDITAVGNYDVASGEMTIVGGHVEATIVYATEGKPVGSCTRAKDRTEISLEIQNGRMSGNVDRVRRVCDKDSRLSKTLTAARGGDANGALDGEWNAQYDDEDPFVVLIQGLAAKVWDVGDRAQGKDPAVSVSIANGLATASAKERDYTFVARKR